MRVFFCEIGAGRVDFWGTGTERNVFGEGGEGLGLVVVWALVGLSFFRVDGGCFGVSFNL